MAKGWIVDRFIKRTMSLEFDNSTEEEIVVDIQLEDQDGNNIAEVVQFLIKFVDDSGAELPSLSLVIQEGTLDEKGSVSALVSTDSTGRMVLSIGATEATNLTVIVEVHPLGVLMPSQAQFVTLLTAS